MKKIISMLLVIAMMITVLTVGIATTSAAETATITIYGLDGSTEVKEFSVGDEFTVYTTLDVSASVSNGMIGSVQGTQTYSSDVLELVDEVSSKYGDIVDLVQVFPVTGDATIANGKVAGKIIYNATVASTTNAFKFDSASSKLIVTTYKVTAAGNGEVRNALRNLAVADSALTRIVYEGEAQEGKSFAGGAYFEDPTPTIDHAEVTIHSLDGRKETKSFNIGDTFTAYTYLDVSASVENGKVGSVQGLQRYTASVLELADTVEADGMIADTAKVFPIMKGATQATAATKGSVKYAASSANGFLFNSSASQLITTTYKVTANGYADITNRMIVLGAADEDITRIVFSGELQPGMSYSMPASFYGNDEFPTEDVTDAPLPTIPAPTQPVTQPVTQPATTPVSNTLKVTIVNPDNTTESKEFNIGDTFTVYTTLDITSSIKNGQAANVDGTQTYPTDKLQLTEKVTGEYNEIVDTASVFPVLGDSAVASVIDGVISFNATKPSINNGFKFDGSKLIVTNYKVTAAGEATIKTILETLVAADADVTKIVFLGETQSGMSYKMPGSFTDPDQPEPTQPVPTEAPKPTEPKPTEPKPTEPKPTEPKPTEPKPTEPENKATVTIYGLDGTSATKTFNVGETFTVYTTFDASKAIDDSMIASISASQTFTADVLKSADEVDEYGVVADLETMFPILQDKAVAKISDGLNKYNASTPNIGKGFLFDDETDLLIVTKYTVTAAGNAEIRNTLTTVAAADFALTRVVDKGVVKDGCEIGGIASFTKPGEAETYMLGDSDGNDRIESVDATYVQRYIAKISIGVPEEIVTRNGDVDGNKKLEIVDATYIQRMLAHLKVPYPVGEYVPV